MFHSSEINEIAAALAKAQGKLKDAKLNAENPFFKSKYADLQSIFEAIRSDLSANGIAITQTPEIEDGKVKVTTLLAHSSGQWISGELSMPITKPDPQALGAVITYARRYSLASIVGISAAQDDDAEAAMERPKASPPPPEEKKYLVAWELIKKMSTSENLFELTARTKKYKPDYDALTPAEQVEVRKAKDKRSSELKDEEKKKKEAESAIPKQG